MSGGQCTLLVNSCDAYSELWRPFFTILTKNWAIPYPVALNTERLDFDWPGLALRVLHAERPGLCWTARLRGALERIETPFVLMLLDDFFLTGPVDQARIDACLAAMQRDERIACFSFYPTTGNDGPSDVPGFEKRPQTGLYRFNAQAGLWRRERLISFLCADEDAWQWENEGNRRSFALDDLFYSEADGARIFPYDYMTHGLIGGRWFPATKALFEANGIVDFAFETRGFYDARDWALLPSTASAFQLDSVLYADLGRGFCEQDSRSCPDLQKSGRFCQRYDLAPGTRAVRWDPSTHRGFAIRELQITDETGRALKLGRTNAVETDGALVFLQDDPQLTLRPPRGASALIFEGEAVCPLDEPLLRAAQAKAEKPGGLRGLLHR